MEPDLRLVADALPDYEIGRVLGEGSFGVVIAARHRVLGRAVAVKQLAGPVAADDEPAARFRREARILASLDHSHVVRVFDYREHGPERLLVMELLTGGTFADRRVSGMSLETAIAATMAAASGLHHVHEQGVLHRDVKPENLMLNAHDVVKVTDFGLARGDAKIRGLEVTRVGQFFGTPAYVAPEQAAEALSPGWPPVGPAADQYGLAAVLYETLSGQLTHEAGGGIIMLCARRLNEEPRPLATIAPQVPAPVAEVVMRGVARLPSDRYPSLEDFGVALGRATTLALGPGWIDRSPIKVREAGPIRDAAVPVPEAAPTASVPAAAPHVHHPPPGLPPGGLPGGLGGSVSSPGPGPSIPVVAPAAGPASPRRSRWWALVLGPLAVVAVVVAALAGQRSSGDDPAAPGSTTDLPVLIPGSLPVQLTPAWTFPTQGDVFASPSVDDGLVVIGSFDRKVYGLDARTGSLRWKVATDGAVRGSAAQSGGTAFVGSDDGNLYAISGADGSVRWRAPIGYEIVSTPAVGDGVVVVGADALYGYSATDGTRRWRTDTGGTVVSSPVLAGGLVIVGTNAGTIVAVDPVTGVTRWTVRAGGAVQSSPTTSDGVVFVGANDGVLYALDVSTGAERWRAAVGGQVRSSPATSGRSVFVGSSSGRLVALDKGSGATIWSAEAGGKIDSSPLVVGDHVVVGGNDGVVYVLAVGSGSVEGRFPTGGPVLSSPRMAADRVIVGSYDDSVYAITGLTRP